MTDEEMNQLANLIDKLGAHLQTNHVMVINNYVHDGYYVGVYKDGEIDQELSTWHVFLPDAVKAIMQKKIPNPL